MNGAEILTTIAQLGVAVTGFSGIAIAFNRRPGGLGGFEAFRVSILFANSLAAVFLSLIPFAFFYLGWSRKSFGEQRAAFVLPSKLHLSSRISPPHGAFCDHIESFLI